MKLNQSCFRCLLSILFLSVMGYQACAEIGTGQSAPNFKLPVINGNENIRSEDLFRQNRLTFIVFWKSGCAECVRNLRAGDAFYRQYRNQRVGFIGINADEDNYLTVKTLLEENRFSFVNLWDFTGVVQKQFGLQYDTFSIFLVDSNGILLDKKPDAKNDIQPVLNRMLRAATPGESVPDLSQIPKSEWAANPFTSSEWQFRGKERIRLLGIHSRGSSAVGLYGEPAAPGNRLIYRFDFEISRTFGNAVTAGGLLRIGNEGKKVLRSGPDYFGSEWGSAFVEMNRKGFHARLGYYTAHMSPLTLMRWDRNDNPRIGGDGGCGCFGSFGIITLESLDDLGPDFRFEGGTAGLNVSNIQAEVFYAIPRRALQNSYKSIQNNATEKAVYSLEISGFNFQWQRFDRRTDAFWRMGANWVSSWEDKQSVDFIGLGYPRPDPRNESSIFTLTAAVPLVRHITLQGEWILWNPHRQYKFNSALSKQEGNGGTAGLLIEKIPRFSIKADFVRLSPDFYSPFAALSYEPNRQGMRISTRWMLPSIRTLRILKDVLEISLFCKGLNEMEKQFPEVQNEKIITLGAAIGIHPGGALGGSIGWMQKTEKRDGEVLPFKKVREAVALDVYTRFTKNIQFHLQYQSIDFSHHAWSHKQNDRTNVFSIYVMVNE